MRLQSPCSSAAPCRAAWSRKKAGRTCGPTRVACPLPNVVAYGSEIVARGQAVGARRAIETGQHAESADVVAAGAVVGVGEVLALQRKTPRPLCLPDQTCREQAVAALLDVFGKIGGRIDLALVRPGGACGEAAAAGQFMRIQGADRAGELGRVGELLIVGDVVDSSIG